MAIRRIAYFVMGVGNRFIILFVSFVTLRLGVGAGDSLPAIATSLHLPGLTNEVIRLRVGQIEQAFAKRGFFRLGILPTVRLQRIELCFETGRGLARLDEAFSSAKNLGVGKQVELAKTTIECLEEPFFRITAESVEQVAQDHIAFGGTVMLVTAGKTNHLHHAQLRCLKGKWSVRGLLPSDETRSPKTIDLR